MQNFVIERKHVIRSQMTSQPLKNKEDTIASLYTRPSLFYGTERNMSSHYSTERNGTNTFLAGENITACNSNP